MAGSAGVGQRHAHITQLHDAANEFSGYICNNAGNLAGDGGATYAHDALRCMTGLTTTGQAPHNSYAGGC